MRKILIIIALIAGCISMMCGICYCVLFVSDMIKAGVSIKDSAKEKIMETIQAYS